MCIRDRGEDSIFSTGFFEDKIKELQVKKWHTYNNLGVVLSNVRTIWIRKLNVSLQLCIQSKLRTLSFYASLCFISQCCRKEKIYCETLMIDCCCRCVFFNSLHLHFIWGNASALKRASWIHFCSSEKKWPVKAVLEQNEINMGGLMFLVLLMKQLF